MDHKSVDRVDFFAKGALTAQMSRFPSGPRWFAGRPKNKPLRANCQTNLLELITLN